MESAESSRRLLHERAAEALGAEAAAVLMEHLPPAGWSDLARRSDVEHATALTRVETAAEFATVRREMSDGFAGLRHDFDELRVTLSDALTRQTWRMVMVFGTFAVIVSAVQAFFH